MGASCTKAACCAILFVEMNLDQYLVIFKKSISKYVPQITYGRVVDV